MALTVSVQNTGGTQSKLNQSAILQAKNSRGILRRIVMVTAGSGGALVLNDLASGGTPAAGNQVTSIPSATLTVTGLPVTLDLLFQNGIMVSAIPTGSVINYFFD